VFSLKTKKSDVNYMVTKFKVCLFVNLTLFPYTHRQVIITDFVINVRYFSVVFFNN
jgi:hypothetical protein